MWVRCNILGCQVQQQLEHLQTALHKQQEFEILPQRNSCPVVMTTCRRPPPVSKVQTARLFLSHLGLLTPETVKVLRTGQRLTYSDLCLSHTYSCHTSVCRIQVPVEPCLSWWLWTWLFQDSQRIWDVWISCHPEPVTLPSSSTWEQDRGHLLRSYTSLLPVCKLLRSWAPVSCVCPTCLSVDNEECRVQV